MRMAIHLHYFISSQAVNSMHIRLVFSTVKKYRLFSLVTDTIYIFTVAKQGFLGNFGTGIFYQKGLCEGYTPSSNLGNLAPPGQFAWVPNYSLGPLKCETNLAWAM